MTCSCELVLYALTKDLQILLFNTTRTFYFQIHWAVLLFSALLLIIAGAFIVNIFLVWLASEDDDLALHKQKFRRWIQRKVPGLLAASGSLIIIHKLQPSPYAPIRIIPPIPDQPYTLPWSFFPRTSSSIKDLDQAVALGIGAITLAFSVHDASKSWRRATFRNRSNKDREHKASANLGIASGGLHGENISTLVLDVDDAMALETNELGTPARPDATYTATRYPPKKELRGGS